MRYSLLFTIVILFFTACNKDTYTTAPQIKFKSVDPDTWSTANITSIGAPKVKIELTDAEGDIGFNDGSDTTWAYIKNITVSPFKLDSVRFPALPGLGKKLKVDVDIDLISVLTPSGRPRPHTDTLYFEVYVKDFAKNKSNVIKTEKPVYLFVP